MLGMALETVEKRGVIMSWSCWIKGKNGVDLLKKYGIHEQFLGLAPGCPDDTDAPYRLEDIRSAFSGVPYKDRFREAAQDAVLTVKGMILDNKASLEQEHCESCKCVSVIPVGWSIEDIMRFQAIPLDEVYKAGGGW